MVVVFRNPFISFAVTLWTLASVLPVNAGQFEDAEAAVNTGDYVTALRLLGTLADQDNTYAERLLGIMYIKGRGVPQDYALGMRWMRIAANKGLADAQNWVGILYQRSWGVERNEAEAVKWFRIAADQNSSYAENVIGIGYEHGLYVAQDDAEAFRWYRRAANRIYERPGDRRIQ